MKKRIFFLLIGLITISLACLPEGWSAIAGIRRTLTNASDVEAVATNAPARICARVVAFGALHIREAPGHAARVVGYLENGQIVIVSDQSNSTWWSIESSAGNGYARSLYLEICDCNERGK